MQRPTDKQREGKAIEMKNPYHDQQVIIVSDSEQGIQPKNEGFAGRHGFPLYKKYKASLRFCQGFWPKKNRLWEAGVKGITPTEILNAKRLTTAAGLTGVGISELETTADHRVAVI